MRKITLLLVGVLLTASLALGQTVTDITFDEGFLVNLNADQSARAYNLTLDADTAVTVNTRYLGAAFPFSLEVFDASGQTLAAQTVDTAGDVVLDLPAGAHMLLVSVASGNSGQVILLLSDATSPADANTNTDGPPLSGAWQVTYGQSEITGSPEFECEQYIPLADAELPADGSTVMLSFDGEPRPLDLHAAVAPDGVQEAPDFFMTETLPDGRFEVTPGIQGAPFAYTYTVNSAESITIDYLQTLMLSDCELNATVELTYAGDASDTDAATTAPTGSVQGWTVIGDASEASPPDGEFICGAPANFGADWLFDAPPSFVDQVVDGYGETLTFELRRRDAVQTPVIGEVMLVVGNGILLSYELPTPFANDFTRYEIPLTETAGWQDVDGMFDASNADMFQQMLSDVTRVQIPGNVPDVDGMDTDGFCLRGAAVGAAGVTAADTSGDDRVPLLCRQPVRGRHRRGCPGWLRRLPHRTAHGHAPLR